MDMNVAIVSVNKDKYSETFIHNHVRLLPANIHFLFGGYLPTMFSRDKGHTVFPLIEKANKPWFSLRKKKEHDERELLISALEKYLVDNRIQVILCEYGPSGVEIMESAKKLGIPLVVHFHGYDAYRSDILNSYGKRYPQLFGQARAVISVSKHMHTQLLKLGCEEKKLHQLCYGIDTSVFYPPIEKSYTSLFVACGRFVEKKAPQLTIEAFHKVLRKIPAAKSGRDRASRPCAR